MADGDEKGLITGSTEAEFTDEQQESEHESKEEKEAREKREARERADRAKKRRLIPPFVMLMAGAVVSITMRILHYDLQTMLVVLLVVLLVFYVAGEILKYMLDRFEKEIEEANMAEGEVIEKEPEEDPSLANEKGE